MLSTETTNLWIKNLEINEEPLNIQNAFYLAIKDISKIENIFKLAIYFLEKKTEKLSILLDEIKKISNIIPQNKLDNYFKTLIIFYFQISDNSESLEQQVLPLIYEISDIYLKIQFYTNLSDKASNIEFKKKYLEKAEKLLNQIKYSKYTFLKSITAKYLNISLIETVNFIFKKEYLSFQKDLLEFVTKKFRKKQNLNTYLLKYIKKNKNNYLAILAQSCIEVKDFETAKNIFNHISDDSVKDSLIESDEENCLKQKNKASLKFLCKQNNFEKIENYIKKLNYNEQVIFLLKLLKNLLKKSDTDNAYKFLKKIEKIIPNLWKYQKHKIAIKINDIYINEKHSALFKKKILNKGYLTI